MSRPVVFGEIKDIPEGAWFKGRKEMMPTSFHRRWGAGIDGNADEGSPAIVLSGGYEDDEDHGDVIIYTGAGGNDPNTGQQIADQTWENPGNAGLIKDMNDGLPVRVTRGYKHKSPLSPSEGYTYAGLYGVEDAWQEKGRSGYVICRYRLIYMGDGESEILEAQTELDYGKKKKRLSEGTVVRIVRDTKISRAIKKLYKYRCQVCGISIVAKSTPYAEGAHIKPIGRPHDGDDSTDNILCLCPNHHVMLDKGAFSIANNFTLIGCLDGKLIVNPKHIINPHNLEYHRESHGFN